MNKQKGFSTILLVVIGLLVIAGGVYYFGFVSQSQNDKIGYQTYINDKYNFSIDYPKGYFQMVYLGDPHIPPLEDELLVEINFSSHSFEETEGRYHDGLSQFPDDYKNINVKVFYNNGEYDFKLEPFQVTYEESFELLVEHMKSSVSGKILQYITDKKVQDIEDYLKKADTSAEDLRNKYGDKKIYINNEYGFEFYYPSYMVIKKNDYMPSYSIPRIELAHILEWNDKSGEKGEILIDVIKKGEFFTYNKGESAVYNSENNTLELYNNDTQKIVNIFPLNFKRNNLSGFNLANEGDRPYLGRIFIPTKDKKFILDVNIRDDNNLENTDLPNSFWDNFKLL